ncbi:MAG: hypothetical protein CL908_03600 [Deltaproteobacteria bacterium]|nr:hypothetical protein [Deltaproteobacteria bacterium]
MTRDLAPTIVRRDGQSTISIPVVSEILDAAGFPRAGVFATIVDIVAGEYAIREVLPEWIATSNLSLQLDELPRAGTLHASPHILRRGRTTLVIEVDLFHSEAADAQANAAPSNLGIATVGFSILPRRNDLQAGVHWAEEPDPLTTFATKTSGFDKPILDQIGLEGDPSDPATTRIAVQPHLLNTLGALQGGIVALFLEAAGERFAASLLEQPVRVRTLELHYLKLARKGPIRAQARSLGRIGTSLLVRVEVFDDGQDGALIDVGTLTVDSAWNAS